MSDENIMFDEWIRRVVTNPPRDGVVRIVFVPRTRWRRFIAWVCRLFGGAS